MMHAQATGRPRDPEVRGRILKAANELLEERGLRAMTIESIAERAGASKVTIYRWWSSKAAIVLEAFLEQMSAESPHQETNSPLLDLKAQVVDFARVMAGHRGRLLAGLLAESVLDAEVAKAYLEHWVTPRRDEARDHLQRAVACGEMRAGTDSELVIDALFGPIYFRLMQGHESLSPEFANQLWDAVWYGLLRPQSAKKA